MKAERQSVGKEISRSGRNTGLMGGVWNEVIMINIFCTWMENIMKPIIMYNYLMLIKTFLNR